MTDIAVGGRRYRIQQQRENDFTGKSPLQVHSIEAVFFQYISISEIVPAIDATRYLM